MRTLWPTAPRSLPICTGEAPAPATRSPMAALARQEPSKCRAATLASAFRLTQTGTLKGSSRLPMAAVSCLITGLSREGEEQIDR